MLSVQRTRAKKSILYIFVTRAHDFLASYMYFTCSVLVYVKCLASARLQGKSRKTFYLNPDALFSEKRSGLLWTHSSCDVPSRGTLGAMILPLMKTAKCDPPFDFCCTETKKKHHMFRGLILVYFRSSDCLLFFFVKKKPLTPQLLNLAGFCRTLFYFYQKK